MQTVVVKVEGEESIEYGVSQGIQQVIDKINKALQSKDFINYFGKELKKELSNIAATQVSTINSEALSSAEKSAYLNSMGMEIIDDSIILYNDATIDISTKQLKPTTRAKYPLKLSLAKIIEYGIGYTGSKTSIPFDIDWQYDVNQHGYRGWYYVDQNGNVHWTNGLEGRLIFLRLCWWVEEHAKAIVYQFLKENV